MKNYVIKNQLLFKRDINTRLKVVIPEAFAYELVSWCHSIYMHPGGKSLERLVKKAVHINRLQKYCQDVVSKCVTCIRNKPRPIIRPAKVQQRSFSTYPFERTFVDLIDMGCKDVNGKRYLLSFVCELTGYFDGYPLPSKRDEQVAKGIMELCLRHSAFGTMVSDNGLEFSRHYKAVTDRLGIQQIRTSAYGCTGNFAERIHRDWVVKMKILGKGRKDWSNQFSYVRFHINNTPRDRLDGLSPSECVFGRSLVMPVIDIVPETYHVDWLTAANAYFQELYPSLIDFQHKRYQKLIECDHQKTPKLQQGDKVLVWKPELHHNKYVTAWVGPYSVKRKISDDTYIVVDLSTKRTYKRNIRRLRLLPQGSTKTSQENIQEIGSDEIGEYESIPGDDSPNFELLFLQ